jgi:hypothetical protein
MALAALLCLLWFLAGWLGTDYAIDDTYIHLTYARNLAAGHGLSFHPHQGPLYSCTSPAWVALLSAAFAVEAGGVETARMLSCLAGALTLLLLYRLGRRLLGSDAAVFAPLLLAVNPWWVRWSCSGMETSAAGLLVTASLLLLAGNRRRGAFLLSGLGIVVRPELAVLGPLLALGDIAGGVRRRLSALMLWLLPTAAWTGFAWAYFGSPLPLSAASKVTGAPLAVYLSTSLERLAGMLLAGDALPMAALVLLGVGRLAGYWRVPRPGSRWLPVLLLTPVLLGVLLAGRGPLVSRYLLPAWPALVLVEVAGMRLLAANIGGRLRRSWHTAPLLAAGLELVVLATVFAPHMSAMERNLDTYREAAEFMRDSLPPDAAVAVREVGVFGYLSRRRLVDLEGLVTPGASAYPGFHRDLAASVRMLRRLGVTHLMDPVDRARLLIEPASRRLGLDLVPLRAWSFPGGTSLRGEDYRRVLYRLEWGSPEP